MQMEAVEMVVEMEVVAVVVEPKKAYNTQESDNNIIDFDSITSFVPVHIREI